MAAPPASASIPVTAQRLPMPIFRRRQKERRRDKGRGGCSSEHDHRRRPYQSVFRASHQADQLRSVDTSASENFREKLIRLNPDTRKSSTFHASAFPHPGHHHWSSKLSRTDQETDHAAAQQQKCRTRFWHAVASRSVRHKRQLKSEVLTCAV